MTPKIDLAKKRGYPCVSRPGLIAHRLLEHLWFQVCSCDLKFKNSMFLLVRMSYSRRIKVFVCGLCLQLNNSLLLPLKIIATIHLSFTKNTLCFTIFMRRKILILMIEENSTFTLEAKGD